MAGRKAGSIIPRGPNKHLIRWFVGRGVDGKRMYGSRTIEGTFSQAQKALGKETHDVAHGAYIAPAKQTSESTSQLGCGMSLPQRLGSPRSSPTA